VIPAAQSAIESYSQHFVLFPTYARVVYLRERGSAAGLTSEIQSHVSMSDHLLADERGWLPPGAGGWQAKLFRCV
jgi:hypothetical protein